MSTRAKSLAGNLSYVVLCLLLSAGCSATRTTPTQFLPTALAGSNTGPSISKGEELIYVADRAHEEVAIYKQGHRGAPPIGTITAGINGPNQLFVDQAGTLYVANGGYGAGYISEYPFGSSQPSVTLSFPYGWSAATVSVDKQGNVYSAADTIKTHGKHFFYWNVFGFKRGDTQPSLQIKHLRNPFGVANDRLGNLYVSWGGTSNYGRGAHTHVSECPPMSSKCVDLNLGTPGYGSTGALQVDSNGDLDVGEQDHGDAGWIGIYQPGSVKPNRSIFGSKCFAWTFALTASDGQLYCKFSGNHGYGVDYISVFDYATGKYLGKFDNGIYDMNVGGVALYPAQKLGPPFK